MTSEPTTLVVLGASGDLTERLLLPGLGSLLAESAGGPRQLIGTGRSERSADEWRQTVSDAFEEAEARGEDATAIVDSAQYIQADPTEVDDLVRILEACEHTPILYFALPPTITITVCEALEKVDLPEGTVLAMEKPFGSDSESAAALNRQLQKLVPEERVHRIDHFLGTSTVLNLIGLRFANRLFEPVWNAENIERVEIVYDEDLALEGRAAYYDSAGALVDMIQSHLLQVLALFAMEAPASLDEQDLRSVLAQVLRATEVAGGDPVASSRRARYTAASVDGEDVPSYADEEGVDASQNTETLAEVTFAVNNRRWEGVPFVLRSGKALSENRKNIVVTFKPVRGLPRGLSGHARPDRLVIDLKQNGVSLDLTMNGGDDPFALEQVPLQATLREERLTAYGEVLRGIFDNDPTISVRADVAERCWRIVEPVLAAWRDDRVALDEYPAGSSGPASWQED
ncbi:glucose-6-phosphate dehydrogenase [Planctomonas psychrotolerans]|uniref:glucose-6-phosphate dehydrogenase n=1 Tax=Planctomonas psychrotolerans TaxID=2528712 RepID=UPI00123B9836|nr:glucose-6-phosphate dehydrogenase [Planctomonas psychrotolerans]